MQSNKTNFGNYPLKNDPLGRSAVWGFIKGKGRKTVILLNHHDVVDSYDYENLRDYTYHPEILKCLI